MPLRDTRLAPVADLLFASSGQLPGHRKAHSYFDNAQLRCVFGFYENDSLVSYGVSNPGYVCTYS